MFPASPIKQTCSEVTNVTLRVWNFLCSQLCLAIIDSHDRTQLNGLTHIYADRSHNGQTVVFDPQNRPTPEATSGPDGRGLAEATSVTGSRDTEADAVIGSNEQPVLPVIQATGQSLKTEKGKQSETA